jgi:hypothetical protein
MVRQSCSHILTLHGTQSTQDDSTMLHAHTLLSGPIWKFQIAGGAPRVVIGSQALMNEVSDETRFSKIIGAALGEVRNGTHGMLLTTILLRSEPEGASRWTLHCKGT